MRISTILTLTAAMALTACGSERSGEITNEDGETIEYSLEGDGDDANITFNTEDGAVKITSGDAASDAALPGGFTVIEGADVSVRTIVDEGDEKGALIIFQSAKSPEEIASYYRSQAEAAGINIDADASMNGGRILGGSNADGLSFSISTFPGEEGTTGQLTVSEE